MDSELEFFELEDTGGQMPFFRNGIAYYELFDFHYFNDVIISLEYGEWASWSDERIARRLLNYGVYDA